MDIKITRLKLSYVLLRHTRTVMPILKQYSQTGLNFNYRRNNYRNLCTAVMYIMAAVRL